MSPLHLVLTIILLTVSESRATEKYLGTFPTSADEVTIHARLTFMPHLIKAEKEFTYEDGTCSASDETRACNLTKIEGTELWDFAFPAPNTINLTKLEIHGDAKVYIETVFRHPLQDATESFAISPLHSSPLVHYASSNARSVEVNCSVKLPPGSTTANVTIDVNRETQCSVEESEFRKCKSLHNPEANILTAFYTIDRNHPTRKATYNILCVAEGPSGQSYLSKYVEFPTRGGDYRGTYGQNSNNRIWFKTWFEPKQVKSLVTYTCSEGKCHSNDSETTYEIKEDAAEGVWNFYFDSDPQKTGNWVSVHGEREQDVVVAIRWTYWWHSVAEYSFRPSNIESYAHFPFEQSEEVLTKCSLRIPERSPNPKVVLYDNGVAKCAIGVSEYPECQILGDDRPSGRVSLSDKITEDKTTSGAVRNVEGGNGWSSEILVIEYKVKLADAPNELVRQILCTSKDNDRTYYMSHFAQFPEA